MQVMYKKTFCRISARVPVLDLDQGCPPWFVNRDVDVRGRLWEDICLRVRGDGDGRRGFLAAIIDETLIYSISAA